MSRPAPAGRRVLKDKDMPQALDDLLVVDLSQGIAGPYCARLLGDFGATVIKAEPPGGDCARANPPFAGDARDREKSLFFLMLNLNKKGVVLDLDDATGRDQLRSLAAKADVIVESFPPGYLAARGLDYEALARENPGLVMTSITPFGQSGPYSKFKGDEIVAYATSGIMSISGTRDREPLQHGGFPAEYEAGMNGMLATNVALLARDLTGAGQHVDVSVQDVVLSSLAVTQPWYSFAGGVQGRRLPAGGGIEHVTPCKDGYFVIQQGGGRIKWSDIADFFGREELKDERFSDPVQRMANGNELEAIVRDATKDRTMADLFQAASERGLLIGIVQTPEDLDACPQLAAREYFADTTHPVIGDVRVPYRIFDLSEGAMSCRSSAPLLGQHTAEIFDGAEPARSIGND